MAKKSLAIVNMDNQAVVVDLLPHSLQQLLLPMKQSHQHFELQVLEDH